MKLKTLIQAALVKHGLVMRGMAMQVAALDAVPEAQRGFYKAVDGAFRLDVDGLEDTAGLKTALAAGDWRSRRANESGWQLSLPFRPH